MNISTEIHRHRIDLPFRFPDLERRQAELTEKQCPTWLFAELPPTLTWGRRQWDRVPSSAIQAGTERYCADRGGNETWHGPGQWVGFLVVPIEVLAGKKPTVKQAVQNTLRALLNWAEHYRHDLKIEEGERLGIWTAVGKLASIGIRVRRGWIQSGFAVNVLRKPSSFFAVNPCGLLGASPDFLLDSTGDPAELESKFKRIPHEIAESLRRVSEQSF